MILNVSAPTGVVPIANDADVGIASLATSGGQKLVEDSFGRTIVVYVDQAGRLGITYTNVDPQVTGAWAQPVKSILPAVPYARPAAVLTSPTSLRVIVEGGTGSGTISDVPVTVQRNAGNAIIGISFGAPTTLDTSGLAKYPTAILAHNGDILAAWNWLSSSDSSRVKAFRWNSIGKSWTRFNGTGSVPDDAVIDSANRFQIIPTLIQRHDNNNVYLFGNRADISTTMTMVFAEAFFLSPNWSWGSQNLSYETGVARGVPDAPSVAWDSKNNLVVVDHAVASLPIYSVFTLNSTDKKVHIDTPSIPNTTNHEWGSLEVNATSGTYYIFFMDTTTTTVYGRMGYVKRVGGAWNTTFNVIDPGNNNEGISVRTSGDSCCIDLVYAKGTTAPATINFVRISPSVPTPSMISLNVSFNQLLVGQSPIFSGGLLNAINGSAVSGRTVNIQQSLDLSSWSTIANTTTKNDGSYISFATFSAAGTIHVRAVFQGDSTYNTAVSPAVDVTVVLGVSNSYALIAGTNATLYVFDGSVLTRVGVPTKADLLSVAWRPDGAYALVSGSAGTLLKVTPAGNNIIVQNIPTGLSTRINLHTVAWKPDSSQALIGGTSGTVLSYNGIAVTPLSTGLTGTISGIAWNPAGTPALLAGANGLIAIYNGTTFTRISPTSTFSLNAAGWHPAGFAYIGGTSGALFKYDGTLTGVSNSTLQGDAVQNILFNQGTGSGLITGNRGTLITYTQGVLKRLTTYVDLNGQTQPLASIGNLYSTAFSPANTYTVGTNGTIASIIGPNVFLVSQHVTNQTFRSLSWQPLPTGVSAVAIIRRADNGLSWSKFAGSWNVWQSLSGVTGSAPVLCPSGTGSLDLIVRGSDNSSIWHRSYSNGTWSAWDSPGGATNAQPACAVMGGLLHVVVRDSRGGLWYNSRNDTSALWGTWSSLGGVAYSPPVLIASPSLNRLDLIVQGGSNSIWHQAFVNGLWLHVWDSPGGATPSVQSAASDGAALHIVVQALGNDVWYDSLNFTTGLWLGWTPLQGATLYSPALTVDASRNLHLFVVGTGQGLWHKAKAFGGAWASTWDTAGGASLNTPSVAAVGSTILVFVRDAHQGVLSNILTSGTWQSWVNLGVATPSIPSISIAS